VQKLQNEINANVRQHLLLEPDKETADIGTGQEMKSFSKKK
jgi:hypothetical protein